MPVIASGGAGDASHLAAAFAAGAEAASSPRSCTSGPSACRELKPAPREAGWNLRAVRQRSSRTRYSGRVLMLAWMDEEAPRTRETGEAWFWSRSRQELWRKGATSGDTLAVEELRDDCDGDAILLRVRPAFGPDQDRAESCFRAVALAADLERVASGRRGRTWSHCSTTPRSPRRWGGGARGRSGRVAESNERVVAEVADLWFHAFALCGARALTDVEAELARRASIS